MINLLSEILNGRAMVYGSNRRLMGFHEGLQVPIQIGPERQGVIASVAYSNGTLYHVERRKPITSVSYHKLQSLRQFERYLKESVLVDTLSDDVLVRRVDAVADLGGKLIGVTSPENPEEMENAVIVDITNERNLKKIRNLRYMRLLPLAFLRISAENGHIYVEGEKATAKYTPEESRRVEIIDGTTDHHKAERMYGVPTYIATDPTGTRGAFQVANVIDQPTTDHIHISRFRDGSSMVYAVEKTGEVYMATAIGDNVILGTLSKDGGNIYAVKTIRNHSKEGRSRRVAPVLIAENAFEPGEILNRNNPITVFPSRDDLERIVEKSQHF